MRPSSFPPLLGAEVEEKTLLNFSAEIAFLAELTHPNIVLFIGTPSITTNITITTKHHHTQANRPQR